MDLVLKSSVGVFFWPFLAKLIHGKSITPSELFLVFQIGIIIIEQITYCMWKCFVRVKPV